MNVFMHTDKESSAGLGTLDNSGENKETMTKPNQKMSYNYSENVNKCNNN